jgi:hypothetical protein
MLTWGEFSRARPDLAGAGRALMYQFGVGLAFLGTVRADGGPRVHPMCPLITEDGLFAFLVPSPKREDLRRDGRYAMHCFPADENEDAFYLTGGAWAAEDPGVVRSLRAQFLAERDMDAPPTDFADYEPFEFGIERCLHSVTTGHGDPSPRHEVWRSP